MPKVPIEEVSSWFDQYEVIKEIGSGSFSHVYLANQKSTGQEVAIKILKTEDGDNEQVQENKSSRFYREMKLCGKMNHPNIVQVLDFGNTEFGRLYTVFEYLPGITLGELIKDNSGLPIKTAKELMMQVLHGIVEAHKLGVVHRDLKPENIMVMQSSTGYRVKILDFGISTFTDQKLNVTRLTLTNEFLGTPAYSSPEQLNGEQSGYRADLFSWGPALSGTLGARSFPPSKRFCSTPTECGPSRCPLAA